MEVSRIGAISPQQIDWRRLTAKEIIKYEQQGIEVPTQYLQWAQEFRASLDSNDETTYEMASESASSISAQPTSTPLLADETSVSEESVSVSTEPTSETGQEEKTAAQSKREDLQNAGVSLRNQATIFTADSQQTSKAALESASIIEATQAQSVNEIENLENYMTELLAKAEAAQAELKNEVANLNNDKGNSSAIGKINRLQQQLERYGVTAQSSISVSEADFNQFESTINAQTTSISSAQDFGAETVGIGNELLTSIKGYAFWRIVDYIVGNKAVAVGSESVQNSETAQDTQNGAASVNSENMARAVSYKGQVEARTGVAGISASNESDNKGTLDGKEPESDKDVKSSQNDGTDDTAKLSTNIDEILKRKIRKGEKINI